MSALSTRRIAAVTMAGLVTGAATLVAALAALAAPAPLPTPVVSDTTLVPGQPFTVTFTGCTPDPVGSTPDADGSTPFIWYEITNVTVQFADVTLPDGSVVFENSLPLGTPPGEYTIEGVCDHLYRVQFYPDVTVTVAETAPTPPAPPTDPEKDDAKAKAKALVLAKAKALVLAKAKAFIKDKDLTKDTAKAKAKVLAKVLAKAKAKAKG
ncbi:hypothetical protein GCM10023328_10120 [Modestobacter marinus]|uniref:Ig-like domain-containing protein n=1 Tax=Modestobacter marinus TaxID=477641 RepID=A0A846M644_9ACTN|nr:hypothetical protein [Modestobacter marinus]NIH69940.1 hypothetical protein [Modestobacter marinus]GGL82541.1 hypothetical protein GCM10011589_43730 [Modestobacter marinus]